MKNFKTFLESYSPIREAQQGFTYEKNAAEALKKLDFVPKDFVPAGASHNQPDLMIKRGDKESGCELKISAASAGSLVLKYDFTKKEWALGAIKDTDEEKLFLASIINEMDLLGKIKEKWKEVPLKNNPDSDLETRKRYEKDKKNFPDIREEIPATKIEEYYQKKKTYYVNVGTHGFYLMGSKNPLGFKDIPRFSEAAKSAFRARVQYKGGGNYQFTFELNFSIAAANKSPYNIAPVTSETDVTIATDKIKLPQ